MRVILTLISLFLLPGAAISFWKGALLISGAQSIWQPLVLGVVAGGIFYYLVVKRITGLNTFEHELTHAVVALLFFRRINRFISTKHGGGSVQHSGGFGGEVGSHLIGLAPYYLPTSTLFSAMARPFVPSHWLMWFLGFIGVTFAYHTLSTFEETKNNWTKESFASAGSGEWTLSDIGRRGYVFSGLLIATLTLATHGVICFLLIRGYQGLSSWASTVWSKSIEVYVPIAYKGVALVKQVIASI